ncbi:hypothetical protein QJS10_CPA05g00133 [Acorus calamus]|uniref:Uncharacterized protein n=1 Tax=Acorus calamus TaxID=4465 RepID=A0AAV9ETF2_ACOCL|nr:hypothetical protein QJS10_CPA05g00133 [Acorus calamus]
MRWRDAPDDVVNDDTQPIIGRSIIYWEEMILRRFAGQVANPTTVGELDQMVMLAGQGVGLVNDIVPAAEVIRRYVEGVKAIIEGLNDDYLRNSNDAPITTTAAAVTIATDDECNKGCWSWLPRFRF